MPCIIALAMFDKKWLNIEESIAFRNQCQKKVLRDMNLPDDYLTEKKVHTTKSGVVATVDEDREQNI